MKILVYIFIVLFFIFLSRLALAQSTARTATSETVCASMPQTAEICMNDCLDWDAYENGTVYCLGGYGEVCRNNALTKEVCNQTFYGYVKNYYNGSEYIPIDNSIYMVNRTYQGYTFTYGNEIGDSQSYFYDGYPAAALKKDNYALIQTPYAVGWYDTNSNNWGVLQTVQSTNPVFQNNAVIYPDAFYKTNVSYTYVDGKIKELITISEEAKDYIVSNYFPIPSPETKWFIIANKLELINIKITKDGLDVCVNTTVTGRLHFSDNITNDLKFFFPLSYAWDSNETNESYYELKWRIIRHDNDWFVLYGIPLTWFNGNQFPVYIDPTLVLQTPDTENLDDTYMTAQNPTTNYGGLFLAELGGNSSHDSSIMVKWDLSSKPSDRNVTFAELKFNFYQGMGQGASFTMGAHHVYSYPTYAISGNEWRENTLTYNERPIAGEYNTTAESSLWMGQGMSTGWYTWNVTNMVLKTLGDGNNNVSIWVKKDSGTSYDWTYTRTYTKESTNDDKPQLVLTLDGPPINDQNITGCAILNEGNTTYTLTQNITNSSISKCMLIKASNVTLDCQGRMIEGNTAADYGIYADGYNNVEIKNCTLTKWDIDNIHIGTANDLKMTDIDAYNSPYYGIRITDCDNANITRVNTFLNNYGLYVSGGSNGTFTTINAYNNTQYGVYLVAGSSNGHDHTFTDVQVLNNGDSGVLIWESYDITFNNLTIDQSGAYGLEMANDVHSIFINNATISNSASDGIYYSDFNNGYGLVLNNVTITDYLGLPVNYRAQCAGSSFTNVIDDYGLSILFYSSSIDIQNWNNNASSIILCNADSSTINNLTLNNKSDLRILYTDYAIISNVNLSNSLGYGMYMGYSNFNNVSDSSLYANKIDGIYMYESNSNLFTNIRMRQNQQYGLYLRGSSNRFENVNITDNSDIGLYIYCQDTCTSSANNTFDNLLISNNNDYGIYTFGDKTNFTNAVISSNYYYGAYIRGDNNILRNVTISDNGGGIAFYYAQNNSIYECTIEGNADYDDYEFYIGYGGTNNYIYNNLINYTYGAAGQLLYGTELNYWNTSRQSGTRIYWVGSEISGNYWLNSSGGYSGACNDSDYDGFCDNPYDLLSGSSCTLGIDCGNNTDYLPLSDGFGSVIFSNAWNSSPSYKNQNTTFNITAIGLGMNIVNLTFWWNETGSWEAKDNVTSINQQGYNFSISLNISARVRGETFDWKVHSCNDIGICDNSSSYTVILGNTAPTLKTDLQLVNASTGHWFNVSAEFSDADGGIDIASSAMEASSGSCAQAANSTSGTDFSITYNCSGTALQQTIVRINATDGGGVTVNSSQIINTYSNQLPTISEVALASADDQNRVNGTLTGNWTANDVDSDNIILNQTKWYKDGVEQSILENMTQIGSGNLSLDETWIFSVRVFDGYEWNNFSNSSSLTIESTPPTIRTDLQFANATTGHWFNVSAEFSDADNATDIISLTVETTSGACLQLVNSTSGNDLSVTYNCSGTALQQTTIRINATDTKNFTASSSQIPKFPLF